MFAQTVLGVEEFHRSIGVETSWFWIQFDGVLVQLIGSISVWTRSLSTQFNDPYRLGSHMELDL